jgi:2-polyprenyl-6-methoxyphenol hydroxylase-like FAD-dependent oxidoreductase
LQIAVAGAGIGGLAAAAGLAQAGHRVVLFDRFKTPAPLGAGLVIQPVGQAVLSRLGAFEAAVGGANRIWRLLGHSAEAGRRVLDVTYDAPGAPRFGMALHRSVLFDSLLVCAQEAGAVLMPGHEVASAMYGWVEMRDGRREGPFDLIVDACGAGSPLSALRARPLGYGALWGTVRWPEDTDLERGELRQVYRHASRMIGVLPLGRQGAVTTTPRRDDSKTAAIFWSLRNDEYARWSEAGVAAWQDEASALWPGFAPFADQITAPEQMVMARYSHGTLRQPHGRGIVHIGDAAHRASPQLGQGANMALLDAWALVCALRDAAGDMDHAIRLQSAARRRHVAAYQWISRVLTPLYQSDSPALPKLRDRVLFPISQIPAAQELLTRLVCGDLLPPLRHLE